MVVPVVAGFDCGFIHCAHGIALYVFYVSTCIMWAGRSTPPYRGIAGTVHTCHSAAHLRHMPLVLMVLYGSLRSVDHNSWNLSVLVRQHLVVPGRPLHMRRFLLQHQQCQRKLAQVRLLYTSIPLPTGVITAGRTSQDGETGPKTYTRPHA